MYKKYIKRILDIIISFILILITFPLIIILLIVTKFNFKGSPIFKQLRIGLNEKHFYMYKIKTMDDKNKDTTKFSRFLRNTGLDELLQLYNVLIGDMSIIGPRPFIVNDPLPTMYKTKRHSVKPGITGYAQVNGRRENSHNKKLELDNYYVDNISFILDLKIFFKTIYEFIINIKNGFLGK